LEGDAVIAQRTLSRTNRARRAFTRTTGPSGSWNGAPTLRLLAALGAVSLALLGSCSSMVAPHDIYGYKGFETRYAGAATAPDRWAVPLHALDPASATPLLVQLMAELAKTDPDGRYRGITYDLSTDNQLAGDWLLQTPNAWGVRADAVPYVNLGCSGCDEDFQLPACTRDADCGGARCAHLNAFETGRPEDLGKLLCVGQSDRMLDAIYAVVASARKTVDIAVLADLPDSRFLATLRNALMKLARSGRPITVRLLAGTYPTITTDPEGFLHALVRDAAAVPGSQLSVYVGTMRSCAGEAPCGSFSWNHAKIVAADGRIAFVGGHNMWTRDYLLNAPVHDLSMTMRGGAARSTDRFLDALWDFTCAGKGETKYFGWRIDKPDPSCPATLDLPPARPGPGKLMVASVARLGAGVAPAFHDQSDIAAQLMLAAAQHTVRLSQQDLGFSLAGIAEPVWPEAVLRALADLLAVKHGDVYIVLSAVDAEAASGNDYSTGVTLEQLARKLKAIIEQRTKMPDAALNELLCHRLHLAALRFNDFDKVWPGGYKIANHAKLWVVDDRAFYIGSHNLYPVDLQEFGYIVESRPETERLLKDYWDRLWYHSSLAAISGDEAFRCALRHPPPTSPVPAW
jgi:phosphatidylserine/phosphatidylglycerophosphate/cardiolipin synthase-like enzyme